jgi:hypothetical protein
MSQASSKVPSKDSVDSLYPIQTIIFDDPIINEAVLSEDNVRYHVCFASHIYLRKLSGFEWCKRLFRIAIPPSVEVIDSNAFSHCSLLSEVIFAADSHLETLGG